MKAFLFRLIGVSLVSFAFISVFLVGFAFALNDPKGASPATTKLDVTELEQLKLEAIRKDFTILQYQAKELQLQMQQLQQQAGELSTQQAKLIEEVKKAHKWGEDVVFIPETGQFERQAKTEAKK